MLDLWADTVTQTNTTPPVAILREQAKLLAPKTKNLVKAEVTPINLDNEKFVYNLYIIAPKLNNYYYRLLSIQHKVEMYPVRFLVGEEMAEEVEAKLSNIAKGSKPSTQSFWSDTPPAIEHELVAKNETEFIDTLKLILGSYRTGLIVSSLNAQINALKS